MIFLNNSNSYDQRENKSLKSTLFLLKNSKTCSRFLYKKKNSSINGYYGYDGNDSESKEFLTPKLVRRRQLLENQNCLKLLL